MNIGTKQVHISHDIVNTISRLTLKPVFSVVPLKRRLLDSLPAVLHLTDPIAQWFYKCNIDQFMLKNIPAEWVYSDRNRNSKKVVLFLHGGGFIGLGPVTHRGITSYVAKKSGAKVLAIRYRKAPEHKYPAQINDALMAWDWLIEQGYKPENICLMGDSAGGNLSLTTTLKLIKENRQTPACVCALSPWCDLTAKGESITKNKSADAMIPAARLRDVARAYAGYHSLYDPLISPLFANFEGFPPLMIQVGSTEVLHGEAVELSENAKRQSSSPVELIVWENASHVFQVWDGLLADARQSLRSFAEFIDTHTNS